MNTTRRLVTSSFNSCALGYSSIKKTWLFEHVQSCIHIDPPKKCGKSTLFYKAQFVECRFETLENPSLNHLIFATLGIVADVKTPYTYQRFGGCVKGLRRVAWCDMAQSP